MLGPGIEPGSLQKEPSVVPAAPPLLPGEAAVVRRESAGLARIRGKFLNFFEKVELNSPTFFAKLARFFRQLCELFFAKLASIFRPLARFFCAKWATKTTNSGRTIACYLWYHW